MAMAAVAEYGQFRYLFCWR